MRVLLAEDDQTTCRLISLFLSKWGYDVVAVADGCCAWELLQQPDAPRLVVLDWEMPGLQGVDICRRIRQQSLGQLSHIIILTARESREDVVAAFAAGANDFITKPFHRDELQARIKIGAQVVQLQSDLAHRVDELEDAIAHIKQLQGILPICMYCHKIRDDREVWQQLEDYITENTEAMLSHSLCPECYAKQYRKFADKKQS